MKRLFILLLALAAFTCLSYCGGGGGNNSAPGTNAPAGSTDQTPPTAISNLNTNILGATSIELSWTATGDDNQSGQATSYSIRYSTSNITGANFTSATVVSGAPSPKTAGQAETLTVTGLTASTLYYFAITVTDDAGNVSGISNVVSATTQAAPPDTTAPAMITLALVSKTTDSITLSWTAPANDGTTVASGPASSYILKHASANIDDDTLFGSANNVSGLPTPGTPGNTQQFTVTGLTQNTAYYFSMKATDGTNTSVLNTTSLQVSTDPDLTPPAQVTSLQTTATGETTISISWVNPTDADYASAKVLFRTGANAFALATTVNKPGTTATISGLTASTNYDIQVVTVDTATNESTPSSINANTTTPDLTAPTITASTAVAISGKDNDQITVTFSEPVNATDAANINNFAFESPNGNAHPLTGCSIAYDTNTKTTTINLDAGCAPTFALKATPANSYTITVSNVKDLASAQNTILANSTSSGNVSGDNTAPAVNGVSPNPAIAVSVSESTVLISFNEAIDTASVAGKITISTSNGSIIRSLSGPGFGANDTVIGYTLSGANFDVCGLYSFDIAAGILDVAGNDLGASNTPFFTDCPVAGLVINKVRHGASPDFVELYVTSSGTLNGSNVCHRTTCVALPNKTVTSGQYVVAWSGAGTNDTVIGDNNAAYWDFYSFTAITGTDSVISVTNASTVLDAMAFSDGAGASATTWTGCGTAGNTTCADAIVTAGQWTSSGWVERDALFSDGSSASATDYFQRCPNATDTNNKADWMFVKSNDPAASIGSANVCTAAAAFNVSSATAASNTTVDVVFSRRPNLVSAVDIANYCIAVSTDADCSTPDLTISGATLTTSTVTLTTSAQNGVSYKVYVNNILAGSAKTALTTSTATFNGNVFNVNSATALSANTLSVTFSAAPIAGTGATGAENTGNYTISGFTISGAVLAGSTVTLTTVESQTPSQPYTVTVSNVLRASDNLALAMNSANFNGFVFVAVPTVSNVVVSSTSPNNGTTPFNTGTSTVIITGTDFSSVSCPTGVKLDNVDGANAAVNTQATSCTVDSDTQITATFPAGIKANPVTGWNVQVTNSAGTNTTSAVTFKPQSGLLISEVLLGTTTSANNEFVELYNPTAQALDLCTIGGGANLKLRRRTATGTDSALASLVITNCNIPSHGFFLAVSAAATAETWYVKRDATFTAAIAASNMLYLSTSASLSGVLDLVGWGTITDVNPGGGCEGGNSSCTNLATNNNSIERKPAGGLGHATDSNNNLADFNAQSTSITPMGTVDPSQP